MMILFNLAFCSFREIRFHPSILRNQCTNCCCDTPITRKYLSHGGPNHLFPATWLDHFTLLYLHNTIKDHRDHSKVSRQNNHMNSGIVMQPFALQRWLALSFHKFAKENQFRVRPKPGNIYFSFFSSSDVPDGIIITVICKEMRGIELSTWRFWNYGQTKIQTSSSCNCGRAGMLVFLLALLTRSEISF